LRVDVTRLGNILYIAIVYIYRIFVVGRAMLGILNDLIEKIMHVIIIIRL
jgi:hypothetical protein